MTYFKSVKVGHPDSDPGISYFTMFNPKTNIGQIFMANKDLTSDNLDEFKKLWNWTKSQLNLIEVNLKTFILFLNQDEIPKHIESYNFCEYHKKTKQNPLKLIRGICLWFIFLKLKLKTKY